MVYVGRSTVTRRMRGEASNGSTMPRNSQLSKAQSCTRAPGRTTRPHTPSSRFLHVCEPALRCSTRRVACCICIPHLRKLTTLCLCTDLRSHVCNIPVCIVSACEICVGTFDRIRSMLTLAMQSGAFLQLVVTLTALVARLAHLSSALRHVLSALHAESIRLLDTLHVRDANSTLDSLFSLAQPAEATHNATPLPPPPPLDGEDAEAPSASLASIGRVVPDSDFDMSTDLGETIAGPPVILTPRSPKSRSMLDLLPTQGASAAPAPVARPRQYTVHLTAFLDLIPLRLQPLWMTCFRPHRRP